MDDITYTSLQTTLGDLLVTDHGQGISGLYFPEHRRGPVVDATWIEDASAFREVADELDAYFAGERTVFDLPIDPRGTTFQLAVWEALREVDYGRTISYGQLADRLGRPTGARAVASAVARNPISIIVPCHRVVGANGTLTGYAGGVPRKRQLLRLEGATTL